MFLEALAYRKLQEPEIFDIHHGDTDNKWTDRVMFEIPS